MTTKNCTSCQDLHANMTGTCDVCALEVLHAELTRLHAAVDGRLDHHQSPTDRTASLRIVRGYLSRALREIERRR